MSQAPSDFDWHYGARLPPSGHDVPHDSTWRSRALKGELKPGSWLGDRFRVVGLLGRGGMGVVYRAQDPRAGREVALKVLARQLNARQMERFRREGQLTALLNHPGIVGIHEAGVLEGIPFLSYELVEGGRSLEDAFSDPTTTRAQRVEWVAQAAEALGHAHERGVIHRDVKPANVLVDESGKSRVADFGLALGQGSTRMTQTGAMLGTPTYMPPEQISGGRDLTSAADVWSLGVMLYEALTRELPFGGDSLLELARRICEGFPEPPRGLDASVDRSLEAVCLQCLIVDADQRYPHAGALAEDLRRAQRGEAVTASSLGQRWVHVLRRSKRAHAALAIGAAILAALALVAGFSRRTPGVTPEVATLQRLVADHEATDPLALQMAIAAVESTDAVHPKLLGQAHLLLAVDDRLQTTASLAHARHALELLGSGAVQPVAKIMVGAGLYGEAADALATFADDSELNALIARGEVYLLADRVEAAASLCDRLRDEHPRDLRAVRFRAQVGLAAGEVDEAKELLARIPEEQGGIWIRLLSARLAAARGEDGLGAMRRAARGTERTPKASRAGERATVLEAYLLLGEVREAGFWLGEWPRPRDATAEINKLGALVELLLDPGRDLAPLAGATPAVRHAAVRWLLAEGRRNVLFRLRPRRAPVSVSYRPSDFDPAEWGRRASQDLALLIAVSPASSEAIPAHLLLWELARLGGQDGSSHLLAAQELNPSDPAVRVALAEHALASDRPDDCLALLASPAIGHERRASLAKGQAYLALGRAGVAVEALRDAYGPERKDDVAGESLALALRASGAEQEAAEVELRVARLRGSERPLAQERYSLARDFMKEETQASRRVLLLEALELYPHLTQAEFILAKYQGRGGNVTESLRRMVQATASQVYIHARDATSVMREMTASGLVKALGGQSASVLDSILVELESDPRPEDGLARGFLHGALVEFENGLEEHLAPGLRELNAVIEEHPDEILAWIGRGYLHMRAGHPLQAERDLTVAIERAPDAAWFYMGLLRAQQNASSAEVLDALAQGRKHGHPGMPLDELSIYPELERYLRSETFRKTLHDTGWR